MNIPGDKIPIKIKLNDIILEDNLIISYIYKNILISCGHCLPKNSLIKFGEIKYTSGFDNPEEKKEISIIILNDIFINKFSNLIENKKFKLYKFFLKDNDTVFNYFNRNKIYGNVLKLIKSPLDKKTIKINDWCIDNQIDKLNTPFYLIIGNEMNDNKHENEYKYLTLTSQGYSGSPWIIEKNNKLYHIGIHIGKTYGYKYKDGKIILKSDIAYVKPII